jgi:lipoate-protein ligase A
MVLHHNEVTYSLSSCDDTVFPPTVAESYKRISTAMMIGLKRMGLTPVLAERTPQDYSRSHLPCFSSPARDEVLVSGKKIIGSAQKRIGSRFLQHGSIPLENSENLLASVATPMTGSDEISMIPLSRAVGTEVSFDWAVGKFMEGISEFFKVYLNKRTLNAAEQEAVRKIQRERYSDQAWTFGSP